MVVEWNHLAVDLLAIDEGNLRDRPLSEFVHDADYERVESLFAGDNSGEPATAVVHRRADPSLWLEMAAIGDGDSWVVTLRDVTEQVRTLSILSESAWTVTVSSADGRRLWGPVGREHPRDQAPAPYIVPSDRVHPEDLEDVLGAFHGAAQEAGRQRRVHARLRDVASEDGWVHGTVEIINALDVPEVGGMILRLDDRAESEAVASIAQTRSAFQSVAEAAPIGIVLTGPSFNGAYFNEAVRAMLPGLGAGDAIRDWTELVDRSRREEVSEWLSGLLEAPERASRTLCFDVGPDGPLWALVTVAPRFDEEALLVGFIVTFQDVTAEILTRQDLEEAQEHLLHLVSHDPLTGLANRTLLDEALERIDPVRSGDGKPEAGDGSPVGMLFCDLDGFKAVNDDLGHEAGDRVLVEIAERLRSVSRSTDLVARLGGDEFLVLATATPADLESLAERITAAIAEPITIGDRSVSVGVTIGAASTEGHESLDELLRRADAAMYRRKLARRI